MNWLVINPRNISLAVMAAAVALSVTLRPPSAKDERSAHVENRSWAWIVRIMAAQSVMTNELPEAYRADRRRLLVRQLDQIEAQGELVQGTARVDLAVIRVLLGEPARLEGDSPEARDFRTLYLDRKSIPAESPLFRIPSGRIAELQNATTAGQTEKAAVLSEELKSEATLVQTAFAAGFLIFLGLVGGSITFAIVFFSRKPEPLYFPALSRLSPEAHQGLLDVFVVYLFISFAGGRLLGPFVPDEFRTPFHLIFIPGVFLACLIYYARAYGLLSLGSLLVDKGTGIRVVREVFWGIAGFLLVFPTAMLALLSFSALAGAGTSGIRFAHPVVFEIRDNVGIVLLLAAGIVPIVEEVMFRVFAYGYLRRFSRVRWAGLASAAVFAVLHPQGWIALPYLTVIGFGFALLREFRPGVIAPIVAHALVNSTAVVTAYLILK